MTRPFDPNLWTELERDPAPSGLVRRRSFRNSATTSSSSSSGRAGSVS